MTPISRATLLIALGLASAPALAQRVPEGEPPTPTREERQRNNAAKLAALVTFVKASCPEATVDDEALKTVVARLGVDPADIGKGDLPIRMRAYMEAYQKDVPANCARAQENFGEGGKTLPGLIGKR